MLFWCLFVWYFLNVIIVIITMFLCMFLFFFGGEGCVLLGDVFCFSIFVPELLVISFLGLF